MIVRPTLVDMLQIVREARQEEVLQYEATTGVVWEDDAVANYLYNKPGVKFAAVQESRCFSIGGWEPVIPGVWEAWMVGTEINWKKHWRTITKESVKICRAMWTETDARRLQIPVLASRAHVCEWFVRALKFEHESTLRNYGVNGEDVAMYVKFREA